MTGWLVSIPVFADSAIVIFAPLCKAMSRMTGKSVIGLALAYFMFRKNKKGLVSSILEPLLGEKMTKGWLGKLVDILAVLLQWQVS